MTYVIADFGGLRTEADTARILRYREDDYRLYLRRLPAGATPIPKEEWRPINAFGKSHHNYGAAFDVRMIRGTIAALGALAPQAGLRWGGTFPRYDGPHFELRISLAEARARWAAHSKRAGASPAGVLGAVAGLGALILWGTL